jgi:uncharacterized membrane protein
MGAVLPSSAQRVSPPSPKSRYLSIDILRTLALILIIQVHAADHFSENVASPEYLFNLSQVFGHMGAPLFALLAGLSYSLWLAVQRRAGLGEDNIVKFSLRRGMFVFALGIAVNVFIWLPGSTFDWEILTLLGASAMILTWARDRRPGVLISVCLLILLVTPPLRDLARHDSYWVDGDFTHANTLGDVLLGFFLNGYFPLLPWLLYGLVGFALGQTCFRTEGVASLPLVVPLLGILLTALAALGVAFHASPRLPAWAARYYATGWPDGFNPATTVLVLGTLGVSLIAMWVLNHAIDRNPRVAGTGKVLTFFRRYSSFALSAYVAHLAVQLWPMWIIAWWQQKAQITFYEGQFMNLPAALVSAVLFVFLFYLLIIVMERHRKYSLEYFMRWISS